MPKITILSGLPASGKSEWASHQNKPVVSRDTLRVFLGSEEKTVFDHKIEERITKMQQSLVKTYLNSGLDVIIDDMNLRSKYVTGWIKFALEHNAQAELKKFCIPVEDAVYCNSERARGVPEDLIYTLARKFTKGGEPIVDFSTCYNNALKSRPVVHKPYAPDTSKPKAIIVDLDGTLAHNNSGRGWYALDDSYFEDDVDESVQFVAQSFYGKGYSIIFVSGRDERCREVTERWLKHKVGIYDYHLYMRPAKDKRQDSEVKMELFDKHIRDKFNVVLAVDDRRQVVEAWRSVGLKVWAVAEGDY